MLCWGFAAFNNSIGRPQDPSVKLSWLIARFRFCMRRSWAKLNFTFNIRLLDQRRWRLLDARFKSVVAATLWAPVCWTTTFIPLWTNHFFTALVWMVCIWVNSVVFWMNGHAYVLWLACKQISRRSLELKINESSGIENVDIGKFTGSIGVMAIGVDSHMHVMTRWL